ncbi:hypothetical protein FH608_048595, partial [Nonomuraea phyllanthi]
GGSTTAYEWDAAGNRTKAGDATFTYDERNRLTSGDGTDYTYTARGTLATSTKAGATTSYTFDAFDRLIADGDSLYSYDALDRMTSRIRGTAKHTFAYSGLGNDLAAVTDSGGVVQARYARDAGGGLLGLKEGTGAAVAALTDLHGDLVATFTTSLQSSAAYDPFGTVTAQTGTSSQLGYQGEYTDPDTGKLNMHTRWYQPGTGTFTSRDTADLTPNPSVQANRYTYANASPLTGTDPTGHATISIGSGSLAGFGYSGSGSSAAGCIGYSLGACGGGDAIDTSNDMIGACLACVTAGEVITSGFVLVMTEEQMRTQNVLPNGMEPPKGFWATDKAVRKSVVELIYKGATEEIITRMWARLQIGGLPAANATLKIAEAQADMEVTLSQCRESLRSDDCQKLIKEKWEEFRSAICENPSSGKCTPTKELKDSGYPVELYKFLGSQPPGQTNAKFTANLIKWAEEHGKGCSKSGILTVCTGLRKTKHFDGDAMTLSSVMLTDKKPAADLLRHEAVHARQWATYNKGSDYWPTFLVYYMAEGKDPCENRFEQQAGKAGRPYKCS